MAVLGAEGMNTFLELYDFDNASGAIVFREALTVTGIVGGFDFSPSSRYLFVGSYATVFSTFVLRQYDLNAPVVNTSVNFSTYNSIGTSVGNGLSLAPDGKIYFTFYHAASLGVINTMGLS